MAKVVYQNQTEAHSFEGKEECIAALHAILQNVTFNFEVEAEEGEELTDAVMIDATMRDLARQVVEHPRYLSIFPSYN